MAFENHPAVFAAIRQTGRGVGDITAQCWCRQSTGIARRVWQTLQHLLFERFGSRACVLTFSEYEAGRGLYGII